MRTSDAHTNHCSAIGTVVQHCRSCPSRTCDLTRERGYTGNRDAAHVSKRHTGLYIWTRYRSIQEPKLPHGGKLPRVRCYTRVRENHTSGFQIIIEPQAFVKCIEFYTESVRQSKSYHWPNCVAASGRTRSLSEVNGKGRTRFKRGRQGNTQFGSNFKPLAEAGCGKKRDHHEECAHHKFCPKQVHNQSRIVSGTPCPSPRPCHFGSSLADLWRIMRAPIRGNCITSAVRPSSFPILIISM